MNAYSNRKISRSTAFLLIYFYVAMIVPNFVLLYTESYSIWSNEALLLLPLGFYMIMSVALKRSGVMIWVLFPFIFLCAFQIILLYLFGNSVIAADMFTNLLTTNPGEAGELLGNIYPSVILVCVIYIPVLWLAFHEIGHKRDIPPALRKNFALVGASLFTLGLLVLIPAYRVSEEKKVILTDIFPMNVLYNAWISAHEFRNMQDYEQMSDGFRYNAVRVAKASGREIYVYIIGEAARASNWQLYGYDRQTNPKLSRSEGVVVFRNVVTQSNTTHKSVPMMLSSVSTSEHAELYKRTGLPALFRESGFKTWFISNQSPQGAMVDKLSHSADSVIYLGKPRYDMQLLDTMKRIISTDKTSNLFFVLHCYGSHFSYHYRYPREFAKFTPDDDVAITRDNMEMLINAYDNSILYTDHFLAEVARYLDGQGDCSAVLYCSDHGEDILDDERGRFLHASPTTTFNQLYIASLAWFSREYRREFPEKAAAASANWDAPATTYSMFQTIADMASVKGDHLCRTASLVCPDFDRNAKRYYLNDHNHAVEFPTTGMSQKDLANFKKYGVEF